MSNETRVSNAKLSDEQLQIVYETILEQLDLKPDQIMPAARIIEDLGADSLDIAEMSINLEERFNLTVPDEAWDGVATVGDLCEALGDLLHPSS